jgi:hypothetical protein
MAMAEGESFCSRCAKILMIVAERTPSAQGQLVRNVLHLKVIKSKLNARLPHNY